MKFYLTGFLIIFLFSSCLKQSIADAMLESKAGSTGGGTASLSYDVNGNHVQISVANAGNQPRNPYYTLGCTKSAGYYMLSGLSNTGDINFVFATDSLTTIKYTYTGGFGGTYFLSYNNQPEYVYAGGDFLSFTVTSYSNGRISGVFSGQLTPLQDANNNTFGPAGSILITNGSFQNVPVFY